MSQSIAIVTDSSSTIGINEYKNVFVIPMSIIVDDEKTFSDVVDISSKQFCNLLAVKSKFAFPKKTKAFNVKTSMPSPESFINVIKQTAENFDRVICLPLSSGLSGTFGQWQNLLKSPSLCNYKNVAIFETSDIAISLRWLVESVLELGQKCSEIEEIEKFVCNWRKRIDCMVVLNNLQQLVRGGRITQIQAILTGILQIKPIIRFHHKNEFFSRSFSNKSAIEKSFLALFNNLNIVCFDDLEKIGFSSTIINPATEQAISDEIVKFMQNFFKSDKKTIESKFSTAFAPAVISAHTGIDSFSIQILQKIIF